MTQLPLATKNALLALLITVAILGTIVYAINRLDQERIRELDAIQTELATDTLSLETQFALLEEAPCEDLSVSSELTQEVSDLGDRLGAAEGRLGSKNEEVLRLKKQYTLLQIRDYLLTKRLSDTCGFKPVTALYFYSNEEGSCESCNRAGYALSYLHQTYPALRVYSFDYNLDLGALKTLIAVEKVDENFPAFVINGKRSYGFTDLEEFETRLPKSLFATSTATTTSKAKK